MQTFPFQENKSDKYDVTFDKTNILKLGSALTRKNKKQMMPL